MSGKNIVILGGTGTLGRALVKLLREHDPAMVTIFSRDEIKQLQMMDDFLETEYPFLNYKLGDVRDKDRLQEVIVGAHYVIHAAAIKHVVMAEKNPEECWKTNVIGTQHVVEACKEGQVEKALLISTDKAVNPLGVYGKSKQEAEALFLADTSRQFSVVRLGNIIGARGSVFEAFEKQRKTGVIKVTHPEATRFCISQVEAAGVILNALHGKIQSQHQR
ncbi:polysaccharide biosynthesis protein [Ekhidna sp.]|uniref:polysaccharide biosynthesis protein n=1 Tax=Ekhidna sp. TaxID=2608089 RepID=UPI0035117282